MKLIVLEPRSDEVGRLWDDAEQVMSSQLLYPEARSALGRWTRSRRLDAVGSRAARLRIEHLWGDVERVAVGDALAREAGELAERHGLRGYDAVHLASAASLADDELVFVADDRDLLEAARSLGLTTSP